MKHDHLRRLMRRIALGLPFAIPVVAAPFNVGGCIPPGYQCPEIPDFVLVEYEVGAGEEPLDCALICGEPVSCAATDEHHVQCNHTIRDCPAAGRRPGAGLFASRGPAEPVAAWLHEVAVLEAGSVMEFEALAEDLARLGAPDSLVQRARQAADDERGHAALMNGLLEARGVARPVVHVPAATPRGLYEVARENAAEGCVGEAWGALEAHVQSTRAEAADVRMAMRTIAVEEAEHALFSLDLHAWAMPRLSHAEQEAITQAADRKRAELRGLLATRSRPAGLGLLPADEALALVG